MNKIGEMLKSDTTKQILDGLKTAAITIGAELILSYAVKGVVAGIGVASKAIIEKATRVS